jgi:hypothetical protein
VSVTRRTPEELAIARQEAAARPKPQQQVHAWPASQYYDPQRDRVPRRDRPPMRTHIRTAQKRASEVRMGGENMPTVSARSIKVTVVLDSVEVLGVLQQATAIADARVPFTVEVEGRKLRTSFAAKSVRKALATLQANGPENVAVIIQGKLMRSDEISEAGLVAQLRASPKPEASPGSSPRTAAEQTAA